MVSTDPASGAAWAEVPEADHHDVDRAVRAARRAVESGPWADMPAADRSRLLRRLADLVADRADELSRLETRDNGKAIRETATRELPAVSESLHYYAGFADKIWGETVAIKPEWQAFTLREPVGVIGAIVPWNSPLLVLAWKSAPALAAGNAVVIKPSELTSVSALEFAKLVEEAEVPPGVFNVVTGYGVPTGDELVRHPGVDRITFTGEGGNARVISENSLGNLKRLNFELGGKAPHIIFADADYEAALAAAVEGGFIAAGQSCTAGCRVLVEAPLFDRFVADYVAAVERIRVGDPLDSSTEMGAQTGRAQLDKIIAAVDCAREEGATVVCGGMQAQVAGCEGGYFYQPTVLVDVDPQMQVWQKEIFGPVVTIAPFTTEEDAVRLANSTDYGLSAGVWTGEIRRAHRLVKAIRAGMVWVNTYRVLHWSLPFGGVKQSGYGRENGYEVIRMYTEVKSVLIDHSTSRPRWFS
jgi:aldehyde dehydrogenase (NAD+)